MRKKFLAAIALVCFLLAIASAVHAQQQTG